MTGPASDVVALLGEPLAAAVLFGFGLLVASVPWALASVLERELSRRGRTTVALGVGVIVRALGALLAALAALYAADAMKVRAWSDVPWSTVAAIAIFVGLGTLVVRQIAGAVERGLVSTGHPHLSLTAGKAIRYGGVLVVVLVVAQAFGFDLTAVLATAGVLGVAIGFAAQTSLSNVIAGVFLLVDRPFQVGDVVEITGLQGSVLSVTLLSTHVRTFENLVVRWPNEVVLKERVVNYSRLPARRLEVKVRVPLGTPLEALRARLASALGDEPALLLEPPPEVRFKDLDDNGVTVLVRAWAPGADWLAARDAFVLRVHDTLLAGGTPPRVPAYQVNMTGPPPSA